MNFGCLSVDRKTKRAFVYCLFVISLCWSVFSRTFSLPIRTNIYKPPIADRSHNILRLISSVPYRSSTAVDLRRVYIRSLKVWQCINVDISTVRQCKQIVQAVQSGQALCVSQITRVNFMWRCLWCVCVQYHARRGLLTLQLGWFHHKTYVWPLKRSLVDHETYISAQEETNPFQESYCFGYSPRFSCLTMYCPIVSYAYTKSSHIHVCRHAFNGHSTDDVHHRI